MSDHRIEHCDWYCRAVAWTRKVDRAKQRMTELGQELAAFWALDPFEIKMRTESRTGAVTYYISRAVAVPDSVSLVAGDVIQNLRTALDQLAYQLFVKQSGTTSPSRHVYFPISKDETTYGAEKGRKTKGMSAGAVSAIDSVRPYGGSGNETLWHLHELNNLDKHRMLMTVGGAFASVDIGGDLVGQMRQLMPDVELPNLALFLKPADILCPLTVGDELYIGNDEHGDPSQRHFKLSVVLSEPDIVKAQQVDKLLANMINEIEELIPIFAPHL